MNGYANIAITALILLVVSIANEYRTSPVSTGLPITASDYICIFAMRFFHYLLFLMAVLYLLFFNGVGTQFDMRVYLLLILCVVIGWYVFECCIVSYCELLFYKVNTECIETTFQPTFFVLFGNATDTVIKISCILYLLTVIVLLYRLKSVNVIYKILYFVVFAGLFVDALVKSRISKQYYSATNNPALMNIQNTYKMMFG